MLGGKVSIEEKVEEGTGMWKERWKRKVTEITVEEEEGLDQNGALEFNDAMCFINGEPTFCFS